LARRLLERSDSVGAEYLADARHDPCRTDSYEYEHHHEGDADLRLRTPGGALADF